MNKIEDFLIKLIDETKKNNAKWITETNSLIKKYLSNSNDIFRVYKSSLKNSNIYLIMQKTKDYSAEFDVLYDSSLMYVVIESDNNISEITSADVAKNLVYDLYNSINDSINRKIIDEIKF